MTTRDDVVEETRLSQLTTVYRTLRSIQYNGQCARISAERIRSKSPEKERLDSQLYEQAVLIANLLAYVDKLLILENK